MRAAGGQGGEKATDEAAGLLLRTLASAGEAACRRHGHIAPQDSLRWLRRTAGGDFDC